MFRNLFAAAAIPSRGSHVLPDTAAFVVPDLSGKVSRIEQTVQASTVRLLTDLGLHRSARQEVVHIAATNQGPSRRPLTLAVRHSENSRNSEHFEFGPKE